MRPDARVEVPFKTATLPAYVFGEARRGHIVLHGGFDSYIDVGAQPRSWKLKEAVEVAD